MREFFDKKLNTVLSLLLVVLSLFVTIQTVFASSIITAGESTVDTASRVNPNIAAIATVDEVVTQATSEPTEATTQPTTQAETKKTEPPTTKAPQTTAAPTTLQVETVQWATAIPPKTPADYDAQWNAGYLVAIDNPDTSYACGQVTLSDHDRDLLERLCMGEFGSGGFVGASLIAQAVKNAMCFDGFTSVQAVIDGCRYDGSTKTPGNDACKQAVNYIFDQNHDAVQHRIMYMYNPYLVASSFHESQNYILTYEDVRFFDRWGY